MKRHSWVILIGVFLTAFCSLAFSFQKKLFVTPAPTPALALAPFSDWSDGDLIFHDSGRNIQTRAIMMATGSLYTHMGIIRLTKNGPVVVEAIGPVLETPLKNFIARGQKSVYAVYRVKGLTQASAKRVLAATKDYYGKPYDIFFRMDDDRIYCSELPYKAFSKAGVPIGLPQKFGSFNIHNKAVRALFDSRWKEHPDCRRFKNADQCWALIQNQEIISPGRLSEDPKLEKVYPIIFPSSKKKR